MSEGYVIEKLSKITEAALKQKGEADWEIFLEENINEEFFVTIQELLYLYDNEKLKNQLIISQGIDDMCKKAFENVIYRHISFKNDKREQEEKSELRKDDLRTAKEENKHLTNRLRHLLKSKIISSYDEKKNGKYIKDINCFDKEYITKTIIEKKWEIDYPQAHIQYPCDIDALLNCVRAAGKIDAYNELLEVE